MIIAASTQKGPLLCPYSNFPREPLAFNFFYFLQFILQNISYFTFI